MDVLTRAHTLASAFSVPKSKDSNINYKLWCGMWGREYICSFFSLADNCTWRLTSSEFYQWALSPTLFITLARSNRGTSFVSPPLSSLRLSQCLIQGLETERTATARLQCGTENGWVHWRSCIALAYPEALVFFLPSTVQDSENR